MQRRDLLKSAAAAGTAFTILKSGTLRGQNAPSNKLNIALMGVWGRGTAHYNMLRNENVVALCDINDRRTKEALQLFPKAKTYWDWRACLDQKDIDDAVDKILMGLERENIAVTPEERRLVAYHEGGHAVVAAVLPNTDPIHKVTIVPRGQAMGVTQQIPAREKYIYPKDYMLNRLAVMMGGRAAEELVEGMATSGAADDLKQATTLVRRMILEWGMGESLGKMAMGDGRENVFLGYGVPQRPEYSEETARRVDEEIKKILDESYDRAIAVLREHRDGLDRVAQDLLEKEEVPGKEILKLVGGERTPAPHEKPVSPSVLA